MKIKNKVCYIGYTIIIPFILLLIAPCSTNKKPLVKLPSPTLPPMAAGRNSITKVEAKALAHETQVIIHAHTLPTYSLFEMTDPLILIIDMENTRFLPSAKKAIPVNNDLVSYITFLNNEKRNLARLEIYLKHSVTPTVTPQDKTLVVHLTKLVAQRPKAEETKSPTAARDRKQTKEEKAGETPHYTGQKISLDFQEADIHTILRIMAEVSKLNIITAGDVRGKVTVRLLNVPWDQALDIILKSQSLGKERIGNILRVAPLEYFQQEQEKILAAKEAVEKAEPLVTKVVTINYATASAIQSNIQGLIKSDKGSINIDERTNTVIIRDYESNLNNILSLIKELDTSTPQVAIHARIVEVEAGFDRAFGIEWGTTFSKVSGGGIPPGSSSDIGGNFGLPIAGATGLIDFTIDRIGRDSEFVLNATLEAMEQENRIRTISSPKVTTLDNEKALIMTGSSIPFKTTSAEGTKTELVDAVTQLEVIPHITPDDFISMHIKITRDAPGREFPEGLEIIKREAETDVLIKEGDTLVIGGIYSTSDSIRYSKIPFLGSIPILSWLFKSESRKDEKNELLFFITPRIVRATVP